VTNFNTEQSLNWIQIQEGFTLKSSEAPFEESIFNSKGKIKHQKIWLSARLKSSLHQNSPMMDSKEYVNQEQIFDENGIYRVPI